MDSALRPMSTSQLLDRTFQLYRTNFVLFAGIAALPPALLLVGQFLMVLVGLKGDRANPFASLVPMLAVAGISLVLYFVGYCLATGANIFAVSRTHLGKPTSIGESYQEIRPYTWSMIKIAILAVLAAFAVMLVAVVPFAAISAMRIGGGVLGALAALLSGLLMIVAAVFAVRLSLSFSVAPAACVIEKNSGAMECLRRSRFLTKGALGRIFLLQLLAGVIAFTLSMVLNLPAGIAASALGVAAKGSLAVAFWEFLANFGATMLAGPIATISIALIYYDLRVRKEAFDLQLMMEAVGMARPDQAQAQAAGGSAPSIG